MIGRLKSALFCATILAGFALAPSASADATQLKITGRASDARNVAFDVFLPLRNTDKLEALLAAQQNPSSPQYHKWLTPAQFGAQFGPSPASLARVTNYLRSQGFGVTQQTRSVHASGTAAQIAKVFATEIMIGHEKSGRDILVGSRSPTLPNALAIEGAEIFSFSPHVAHTHFARSKTTAAGNTPANRYGPDGPYWFDDLIQAYQYPAHTNTITVGKKKTPLDGTGATIGTLISSDVLDDDINALFNHEHWSDITHKPNPKLALRRLVNGGAPFDVNSGASFEASLDVQQELTGAPGANVVLYNIPDLSDGNVIAGYTAIDEDNILDVVSSSFGECEQFFFPNYNNGQDFRGILLLYNELFQQGNAQGITFLASSGDSAGLECPAFSYFHGGTGATFLKGVSTPASDPNVTAVGGTNVVSVFSAGSLDSTYVTENAWADPEIPYDPFGLGTNVSGGFWGAGGGESGLFSQPSYQTLVTTGSKMRTVPDIGMQVGGCPFGIAQLNANGDCDGGNSAKNGSGNTDRSAAVVGFDVAFFHGFFGVIGTSVSSPEFASVVAYIVEQNGRQGNLNPHLYQLAAQQAQGGAVVYHTNIPGYNGATNTLLNSAYSLSTGVGTPIVASFIGQAGQPQAGLPRTPSNP